MARMRINYDLSLVGMDQLLNRLSEQNAKRVTDATDKATEDYANELARKMADKAPVLTGELKRSLQNSPTRKGTGWYYLMATVDYTWVQEYEHRTKAGFIRRNIALAEVEFPERIQKAVKDAL
ncbi:HK97 gp10 family phage protein [Halalkalibacterium halodurans]|uniref:HK97 gp10 family phage protein n=1 Tax=Halalkalibacterium halodurans TaxID=86665 RepID=UPI002E2155EB|nr:HK97 gp10 family phage protein [Halalkalibacterium halodurans]